MDATIAVLFENEDILAVDKPAGVAVIPERERTRESIVGLLSGERGERLFVVHRLDKEVSGVLLFARNAAAHRSLNSQFADKLVRKTYIALVHGVVERVSGVVDAPLREFGSGRVAVDPRRGRASTTRYSVAERFAGATLLEVHPVTGRRHQVRVHLYSIGHPILGDTRYGDAQLQHGYSRLMLHARRIEFALPSGAPVAVDAPVPASLAACIDGLRAGR